MKNQEVKSKNILKNKNERGITLIALIVTIIVLAILVGVSLSVLVGDQGIIRKTQNTGKDAEIESVKEQALIDIQSWVYDDITVNKGDGIVNTPDQVKDILEAENTGKKKYYKGFTDEGIETQNGYIVPYEDLYNYGGELEGETNDSKGKYYPTDETITVGGKQVAIPGGATVSGIDGEYESVDDGLVIYITNGETITDWSDTETIQRTYDQFVWIPVNKEMAIIEERKEITGSSNEEKYESLKTFVETNCKTSGNYPMAVKKADGTYSGILYTFTDGTSGVDIVPRDYTTTSRWKEPDVVSSDSSNGITSLQGEYKTMIESVEQKGGFWVGRYETTNMNSSNFTTTPVTSIKGKTTGISNVTWYKMYEGQKTYNTAKLTQSTKTTSSMIWGSQWDQIMIWMRNVKNGDNYYITNSVGMGNFGLSGDGYPSTTSPANTGCFDVKNVFDLAGNVYDWTLEAYDSFNRVDRGGTYGNTPSSTTRADYRYDYYPTNSNSVVGSRLTLY